MARTPDPEGQSLIEIAEYRNDAVDALGFYLKSLYQNSDSRFLASTREEFNQLLMSRIDETDLRSSLAILAAVEAGLRIDYQLRVKLRAKDPLSREFRIIYRAKQRRTRFDEDLLDPWLRHHPTLKNLIGELRSALHFRHWLAHGRYWKRPAHGRFDYLSLYDLAELIFAQFPLFRN